MIEKRKSEHVDICLKEEVQSTHNYWDWVHLTHEALPEINKEDIDLSINLFEKKLNAPIIIAGMTGGFNKAKEINENLAKVSAELRIGFGVGSQRAALEDSSLIESYSVVKNYDIPLVIANIGVPQLVRQKGNEPLIIEEVEKAIEMINADVLAIHLNFLQESVQAEGEVNAEGCLDAIEKIAKKLNKPVVVKETGAGISMNVARKLKKSNLAIDVGGLGGTSFSAVEYYRTKTKNDKIRERIGKTFWDWGIPTPRSIINCKHVGIKTIIATGGIRTGLDCAKALALGATAAGIAYPLLKPATESAKAVTEELKTIIEELEVAMFLTGVRNVRELSKKEIKISSSLL